MLVLFRGYIGGKFIPQTKFYSTNNGNLFRKLFFNKNSWKQNPRLSSNSVKSEIKLNENSKQYKIYEPFEKMIDNRRLQAKRSILVQVHSEQSCAQLHEYCLQFGLVKNMIHYSLHSNLHFVIVEFDNEEMASDVIFKSGHIESTQIIPVRSQFLWFKANDHGKQKDKTEINLENVSFSTFGSVATPKLDEINTWLLTCKDISLQMSLLFQAMHLDDLGTRMRFITALQIENTLSGMFPLIRAIPFGSTMNSFGKIGCDLDVVVHLDYQPEASVSDNRLIFQTKTSLVNNRSQQQKYIESIADLIERYSPGCSGVKRILQARVPILKFKHEYTGIECDLSLSNLTGVYMSELLYIYGSFDERVCPLVFTIRYWAEIVNLTNPAPGRWITNFSLTLLTLFYLQNVKVIPTFNELIKLSRQEDRRFAHDVNCTFLRDITPLLNNEITNKSSLAELLKGFYDFYTVFDFDSHAISLRTGHAMPKQEYSALYIVNPLESHLNVSKNVSPEELGRIRIEICNAARHLDRELRLNENSLVSEDEDWGLVSLLQSSQYNSKGKDVFYSAVQKRNPSMSTTRLVAVTDLFEGNEEDTNEIKVDNSKKDLDTNNKKINLNNFVQIKKTTRKR